MSIEWTDPLIARMKACWDLGMSAEQTAKTLTAEFGIACTRNAVIGKLHRENIYSRPTTKAPRRTRDPVVARARQATIKAAAKATKPKLVTQRKGVGAFVLPKQRGAGGRDAHMAAVIENHAAKLAPPPRLEAREKAFEPLPGTSPRIWTERPRMGCRWPVGGEGADMLACCAPTDGRSYCAAHHEVAHTASRPAKVRPYQHRHHTRPRAA